MKIQKFEYHEIEKHFLDEIKSIFHNYLRAICWWKNKKSSKNKVYCFPKKIIEGGNYEWH